MKYYDSRAIRQGQTNRNELKENPGTFTSEGASFSAPSNHLDKQNSIRMAGPGGAFAIQLSNDPELAKRVKGWNGAFAQSRPGAEFFGLVNDGDQNNA
tara:strand:- start:26 stop:319 length:294 start_codon:yes stop_codon:yes gene_type:complete